MTQCRNSDLTASEFYTMRTSSLTCLVLLVSSFCYAQDSFSTIGGDASGSGGSEAFAVGLVVFTEISGSGGSASQGIEHAYEIFPVTIGADRTIKVNIYPNPTTDMLNISLPELVSSDVFYRLYTVDGKQLEHGTISTSQNVLDTSTLPSGTYLLNIVNNNEITQSFTIIKN